VVCGERFEFHLMLRAESANGREDDLLLEQKMGFDGAIESKSGRLCVAAGSTLEHAAQVLEEGLEASVLRLDLIRGALQMVAELSSDCFHKLLWFLRKKSTRQLRAASAAWTLFSLGPYRVRDRFRSPFRSQPLQGMCRCSAAARAATQPH